MVSAVEAYILINCSPGGKLWAIVEAALEIKGVKAAHAVTGEYDVIAYGEFDGMEGLTDLIVKLQSLKEVQRTRTAVAIPRRSE